MSVPNPRLTPNITTVICLALTSWFIIVPLANGIHIPFDPSKRDIIVFASAKNINPYTDYLKFFLLLLSPAFVSALVLTLKQSILDRVIASAIALVKHPAFIAIFTVFLGVFWSLHTSFIWQSQWSVPKWQAPVSDTFHEGEFLGLLPNFTQLKQPFLQTFFIHGFGLDVLPSLLAHHLATANNTIALTRFLYMCETLVTCLGCFWILWELVRSLQFKQNNVRIFCVSVLLFCIFESFIFSISGGGRDTLFLVQFALTLRFFRLTIFERQLNNFQTLLPALLVGFLVPIGFLHTYDRAAYFVLVYLVTLWVALFCDRTIRKRWIGGSIAGLLLSLTLIVSILGTEQVAAIVSQVSYWSKYGKYVAFIPLLPFEITSISFLDWFPILIQASVLAYLVFDFYSDRFSRAFWQRNALLIILVSGAIAYMRILIDRSLPGIGTFGGFIGAFLLAYLLLKLYRNVSQENFFSEILISNLKILSILLLCMGIIGEPGFNIFYSSHQLIKLYRSLSVPDSQLILPDYQAAVQTLQPEVQNQSCFYTLTSEGIWYYLFKKPSCSQLNYLYYVRPSATQNAVIRDLEATQPNIILFSNALWSNGIDGIPITDSASLVYQYILEHYQPSQLIASHWFWKKRQTPLKFNFNRVGNFGHLENLCTHDFCQAIAGGQPLQASIYKKSWGLSGVAILPDRNQPADAVYLMDASRHQLIAASSVNPDTRWSLQIPVQALRRGEVDLQVWGYNAKQDELFPIQSTVTINITD
jgi:hypothetical protein